MTEPLTIPALLERASLAFGHETFLVTPTDRVTFAEAYRRSADLACWLLSEGIGKGSRVGLFFLNGVEWVLWWLAVSRVGALAVPLSTMYTPAEISKVLQLADIGLLIAPDRVLDVDVAEHLETALPELAGQSAGRLVLPAAPYLRRIVLTGEAKRSWATRWTEDATVSRETLSAVEHQVFPADLAVMIHTSGSTADPKGVLHTHGTLVRQTSTWPGAIRAVTGSDASLAPGQSPVASLAPGQSPVASLAPARILCAMPFFWIGGLLAVMGALHDSITLLVLPRLDAAAALDLVESERATGIVGWPAFTQRLRDHPTFADRDLSSAPMLRDGPLDIAMTDVPDGYPVHRTMSETAGGFAHTDIRIVDDDGAPVPVGTTGELLIRGVGTMAGYNKRERWETFDDDGWYHTGDRVYRRENDQRLFYVGRTSELIKAAGANVSPLEVEAVIASFPDVAQCVVVGLDDPRRGEEVCAVLVPTASTIDVDSVAMRARDQLSVYKVPTRWVTATVDQIPTLPSGKLDRKGLRDWVIQQL